MCLCLLTFGGSAAFGRPEVQSDDDRVWAALHAVVWLCSTLLLFWVAYTFIPGVHELMDQLMWAADLTVDNLSDTITFADLDL